MGAGKSTPQDRQSDAEPEDTSANGDKSSDKTEDNNDGVDEQHDVPPFDLEKLQAEIEEVRNSLPSYVVSVGALSVPKLICDTQGQMKAPTAEEGPWDLVVVIAGGDVRSEPLGREAYDYPFKVGIRFTKAWPGGPPSLVRFHGVFHHALVDQDGAVLPPFYKSLPLLESRHTVRGVLGAVHRFLASPLGEWEVPVIRKRYLDSSVKKEANVNEQRLRTIRKYRKMVKHTSLFETPAQWREEWFVPSFWSAFKQGTPEAWRNILKEHLPGEVFSFRIFTDDFCQLLVEEIFNFYASGLPARRPNSMNNYGIILNEIGLEPMIDELQRMLQPLGHMLWPGAGSEWDGHHCFIVRYREGEDLGLDMHTDNSDVTFNICLGLDFKGAGLQFCGLMGASNHRKHTYTFQHEQGSAVCHLGRKRHGADDILTGERLNLILWNHSYAYRQSEDYKDPPYTTEEGPPDQVCLSYTHDRDFGVFKEYPKDKESFKKRGWCPPRAYEYEGFKADN